MQGLQIAALLASRRLLCHVLTVITRDIVLPQQQAYNINGDFCLYCQIIHVTCVSAAALHNLDNTEPRYRLLQH